jgi:hypothetical protein
MTLISAVILMGCAFIVRAQTAEKIETLDARQWDFTNRLPLKGNWSYLENKLVSPKDLNPKDFNTMTFPSLWNDYRADGKGTGCATYALNILLPDTVTRLALEIPQLYSSYNVWVDGQQIISAGVAACDKENSEPRWVYQKVSFKAKGDTLRMMLQLANFHHHKGGGKNPIYLGTVNSISSHFNWSIGSNAVEAFFLFAEGIFFLFFYKRIQKPVVLYFALICITWSIRSVFSNIYPVALMFPEFSWAWLVRIEYITLYLTVIWAALFFSALFKETSNRIFVYLPIGLNTFFVLFTLLTPATIYTRWVSLYLIVAVLVILYGVILIVRALIDDQQGSWFLMISIWVGILIFGYDIAAYHSSFPYNIVLLNIGYVTIFILTTVALLFHLGIFKSKIAENSVLTINDLYGKGKKS